jgi:Protein of unknown function (DUF551)
MWFLIETAPEGEAVIVYPNSHGTCTVANKYHDEWWDILDDNDLIHPTHWRPLPEAPNG